MAEASGGRGKSLAEGGAQQYNVEVTTGPKHQNNPAFDAGTAFEQPSWLWAIRIWYPRKDRNSVSAHDDKGELLAAPGRAHGANCINSPRLRFRPLCLPTPGALSTQLYD